VSDAVEREDGFHVSSFCQDGGCVGVAVSEATVSVRDEKSPSHGRITVPRPAWRAFTASVGDLAP